MSHTPGPWTVEQDLVNNGDIDVHAAELLPVAYINVREYPEDRGGIPRETALANAALIAAAPELLEAAKVALASLRAWNRMSMGRNLDEDTLSAVDRSYDASPEIQGLLKAIAKAEGK